METKYTQGEWRLDMPKNGKSKAKLSGDGWSEFASIIVKTKYSYTYDEAGLANAKLIAAAPELLQALKQFVLTAEFHKETDTKYNTAYNSAKAAIKKATE